jgi:hypothetical protein
VVENGRVEKNAALLDDSVGSRKPYLSQQADSARTAISR